MNDSVETINAAATAIVAAESRVQQATVQRRKWGACLSLYWCFGSPRHGKRIGHAVLVPEPTFPGAATSTTENTIQQPALVLPFIAPPSSPASFFHSEPPSATQSPAGLITAFSANSYSPTGPRSIFAIGPYAHETQLVSPPVFSTLTTEPSTAPFTPPPEPVQLTTPSSPEVPFAKLLTSSLDSTHNSTEVCRKFPSSHYEFQSYQLYPGSPVGHLISPSSVISGSGTSSPFPDLEFPSGGCSFPPLLPSEPPKLLSIDGLALRKLVQQKGSPSLQPDTARLISEETSLMESHISEVASLANSDNNGSQSGELVNHRVSFELTAEEAAPCSGKEPPLSDGAASEASMDPTSSAAEADQLSSGTGNAFVCLPDEISNVSMEKTSVSVEEQRKQPPIVLGTVKEFKFDNTEGASPGPTLGSDWWANEKVIGAETGPKNNWSFFPMIQSGIS